MAKLSLVPPARWRALPREYARAGAIINYVRVEYVGGDDILNVLHILDASVAVIHFGDKYYTK
jgi:hypothetical protein